MKYLFFRERRENPIGNSELDFVNSILGNPGLTESQIPYRSFEGGYHERAFIIGGDIHVSQEALETAKEHVREKDRGRDIRHYDFSNLVA